MSRPRRSYFILVVISSVFLLMGFTYNDIPVDKEDQKKLKKVEKLNYEAQQQNDKANSLYSELANYDDSKPENEKKIESLKGKALDLQINALELQKEANFLEYDVLKKIVFVLKQDYKKTNKIPLTSQLLEELASELFYKSEKLRSDAYQLEREEKESRFALLNEAQEFEKEGLDKEKQIIDIYSGKDIIENYSQKNPSSGIDKNIVINEDLLMAFMSYQILEDSISPLEALKEVISSDSLSSSSLRNTWEAYLYSERLPVVSETLNHDSSSEAILSVITSEYANKKETKTGNSVNEQNFIDKNKIYKIQIAADKKTLPQNVLSKIYASGKDVKMINEEGWNKFSIGDFTSFSEADDYRKKIGVSEAFVVGFEDGVKVDILVAQSETQKPTSKDEELVPGISEGLIFKVQIAANKMKLSENTLKNIYQGSELIDMIEEDGWYKYSIGKLENYEKAVNLKKSANADGSFIVAYNNGVKVPLYTAKTGKIPNDPVSDKNIVFKVQIAADTKKLSSENLHKIYSGYEKIQQYEEDGWLKYSLGEFETFNEANKFREMCGVKGAFVIAFQGDKKLNVLTAKKMRKCYDPKIISDWISNNDQVIYRVQIAASNKELSIYQIKNIYCNEPNVYVIEENGWIKYSIGNFNKYQNAAQMKKNCKVEGAFVVAYKNGKKVNISNIKNN